MDHDAVRALFTKKKDYFMAIKTMTECASLADATAESADEYILLMDRRERLFWEIESLDQAIADIQIPPAETTLLTEIETIKKETKLVIENLIELDRQNQQFAVEIKEALKKGLQDVHKGKASARMYNHDVLYSGFSRFDSKS